MMFSKKFITVFVILSLSMAVVFSFIKHNFVFKELTNKYGIIKEKKYSYDDFDSIENEDKFLILTGDKEIDLQTEENFKIIINDMDKVLETIKINNFNGVTEGYRGIILNTEDLSTFSYFQELIDYVKNGGNLIVATRPLIDENFKEYYSFLGIKNIDKYTTTSGMYLESNLMVKSEGLERLEGVDNHSLDVTLDKESYIDINSQDGVPLLWEKEVENGKVFFANGQYLCDKSNRGLLTGILAKTNDKFIYPIVNSKVFHLDDFPAPFPEGSADVINKEFKMSNSNFFTNIWWTDMVKAFSNYDVVPTGYLILNYEDFSRDLYDVTNLDYYKNNIIALGKSLLKIGGELGIHGFNHQPLRLDEYGENDLGYSPWQSHEAMVKSMSYLSDLVEEIYPRYDTKTYVPPSNIISRDGIKALVEGIPEINVVSALYITEEKDYAFKQEFEKDELIYNLPRYSSGNILDDYNKWMIYSGITINGVFSHFIHPDDVLDEQRGKGLTWTELYKELTFLLNDVFENFGWLRANSLSDGVKNLDIYLNSQCKFSYSKDKIEGYISNSTKEDYFILRTDKDIKKAKGCRYEKIDKNFYLINSYDTNFTIMF